MPRETRWKIILLALLWAAPVVAAMLIVWLHLGLPLAVILLVGVLPAAIQQVSMRVIMLYAVSAYPARDSSG